MTDVAAAPAAPLTTAAPGAEATGGAAPTATTAPATPGPMPWIDGITDQPTRDWVAAKGFKDPGTLAQSALNLEKLIGAPADRIVKLPTSADAAEWNEVYAKLGRPETADKYDLPIPEGDTGEFAKIAKEWFHKAGLSASQARMLAEMNNGHIAEMTKAQTAKVQQAHEAEIAGLKTEWGHEYQARTEIVDRAASAFGMTGEQLTALKTAMGPAAAMKFLHNIGTKVAVPTNGMVNSDNRTSGFGMSPDQAKAEIARLKSDKAFSAQYVAKDDKTRFEAREKMKQLNQIAYPGSGLI